MPAKIVEVSVPEYTVTREPDYLSIGMKVDQAIESNFQDGAYILRAIGADDHPGKTLEDLTRTILSTGTDKYDPERKPVGLGEFSGYDYDIQAGLIEIRGGRLILDRTDSALPTMFGGIIWHFYKGAPLDRGHPVRIDLLMLYDPLMVVRARKTLSGARGVRRGLAQHLYRFKDRKNKQAALLGLVKVAR